MRSFGLICLLLLVSRLADAQEQESKLLDRLLKPNTTLGNSAQNKRFIAADGSSVDKKASTHEFYGARSVPARTFPGQREFSATAFAAHHFRDGDSAASAPARSAIPNAKLTFATTAAGDVRAAADATKGAKTSQYTGQRPFLGQGKSQKSLRAQNQPLTIEQVRELLNKNK